MYAPHVDAVAVERRLAIPCAALIGIALFGAVAPSQGAETARPSRHHDLQNTSWPFLAAETGGAVVTFVAFSLATGGPPEECRWCATNGFDDGVRNALRASDPRPFGYVSHGLSLGVVPLLAISANLFPALADDESGRAASDIWILVNTFTLTTGITDGIKRAVGRERPAFRYGVQNETEASNRPVEANLSFFSGDTAWAFSVAACGTTLAYLHGYESAPWLLGGGAALATGAGVLRIVADMHWATDVVAGALFGTAIGVSVPLAFHRRKASTTTAMSWQLVVVPRGVEVSGTF